MEFWLALQVAPQHERKVANILEYKGFEQFYPAYLSKRQWSDRIKIILQPFFPGYIFCRSCRSRTSAILAVPGVTRIVSFGGKPSEIADEEIETLRRIVSVGIDTQPCTYLRTGQQVRIVKEGALFGITGILKKIKNRARLVISVDVIAKAISIEVDHQDVVPIAGSRDIGRQTLYLEPRAHF